MNEFGLSLQGRGALSGDGKDLLSLDGLIKERNKSYSMISYHQASNNQAILKLFGTVIET